MSNSKIPMAAINELQRALEETPERGVNEVSKAEAIRLLSPQIRGLQAKGYALTEIAGMLAEKGVAVTAAALRSYLSHLAVGKREKAAPQRAKTLRLARSVARSSAEKLRGAARHLLADGNAGGAGSNRAPSRAEEGAKPAQGHAALSRELPRSPEPAPSAPTRERIPPSYGFIPREDPDEI